MERVVRLSLANRRFLFRADPDSVVSFWRIESNGRALLSSLRVRGDETPACFRWMAKRAMDVHGL